VGGEEVPAFDAVHGVLVLFCSCLALSGLLCMFCTGVAGYGEVG